MTGSVSIDISMLTAAHTSMTELASTIDSQRARVTSGTPIALSSLSDGGAAAGTADWLTAEAPKLQTVIDLATLLDTEGSGSATYEGTGSITDAEALLGKELGKQIDDIDIDSVEDRERYQRLADLMDRYKANEGVTTSFLTELGPEGATGAIERLAAMTGVPATANYWQNMGPPENPADEQEALGHLQSSIAGSLTGMLGSATTSKWVDSEEWAKGIGQDWNVAAILLRSADKNGTVLGAEFTQKLGHELVDYEGGDPQRHQGLTGAGAMFGNEKFYDDNQDALKQLIGAADNSPDSAQGVMMDEQVASYLMHDRLTSEFLAEDMDDLVRIATVDSAMDPTGDRAKNAADISSWTIEYAAGTDLDDHYDEELGGIVGTYIADAYETVDGTYPIDPPVPPFHATMTDDDLSEVLQHIGGNDTAAGIVGDHATRLNQVLMNDSAARSLDGRAGLDPDFHADTPGDPLVDQIGSSAGFRGFLEDELSQGMVNDGQDEAEARRKTAELFTLPLDYLPTGDLGGVGGHLGDYLVGDIKDQIIDGYVGDPEHAAAVEGNDNYESARQSTKVQAMYAVVTADSDQHPAAMPTELESGPNGTTVFTTSLHDDWPQDAYGNMKTPGELTDAEVRSLVSEHQHEEGINSVTSNTVNTSWDNFQRTKGDRGE